MRYTFFKVVFPLMAFLSVSCSLDMEYRPGGVSPVNSLMSPEDGFYVKLESSADATLEFSWSAATAEDGMAPQYEVVFYSSPQGDVKYRVDAGFNTSLAISHKEINKAASAAGVATGETGYIYWAVMACRGINESGVVVEPRKIEVKRLLGFENIPAEIYITGEGSENGTDISAACKAIAEDEEGVFTLYHRLEAGKGFTFVSAKEGDYTTYTVTDGILDDQSTVPATVSESGIYKIHFDFNIKAVTFSPVSKVIFNFSPRTEDNRDMEYIGNGCWKMTDYPVAFREESWGDDERYHFRATVDGSEYVWGYMASDSQRPGEMTGSYYNIYEYPYDGNVYAYPFKFHSDLDGRTIDITVLMNGDAEHPTHVIDNIR